MPQVTVTKKVNAPIETVWEILHDFGDVQRWSSGVTRSELTSEGPVGEGSTRHCDLAPFGAVEERIVHHDPQERITIELYETSKMPISSGVADITVAPDGDATDVTINLSYELGTMGRMMKGTTHKQMTKGMENLAASLELEALRMVASA